MEKKHPSAVLRLGVFTLTESLRTGVVGILTGVVMGIVMADLTARLSGNRSR